jgi:hypothetical protein
MVNVGVMVGVRVGDTNGRVRVGWIVFVGFGVWVGLWVGEVIRIEVAVLAGNGEEVRVFVGIGSGPGEVQAQSRKTRSTYKPMCS